jgi:threonine aldolase
VEANEVFVALPAHVDARLRREGALYHSWRGQALTSGTMLPLDTSLFRLVTSFATNPEEVDRFIATAAAA